MVDGHVASTHRTDLIVPRFHREAPLVRFRGRIPRGSRPIHRIWYLTSSPRWSVDHTIKMGPSRMIKGATQEAHGNDVCNRLEDVLLIQNFREVHMNKKTTKL